MSARIIGSGGVGAVIDAPCLPGYYLKLVMRSSENEQARQFWNAVRSIRAWCAEIRYNSGFTKIPVVMQYWIRKDQAGPEAWNSETCLDRLIHHRGRLGDLPTAKSLSPELAEISLHEYVLCSDDLLKKIYRNDHAGRSQNLNLLVTYPIQAWGESVDSLIRSHTEFGETDLLKFLYQGLRSIQFLYKRGCAHRDIKPSNILLESSSNSFRLTDFDAFLSPESPSTAGTEAFLPAEGVRKQLWAACRNDWEKLEYYVRLDCFALAGSALCMAEKTEKPFWEDLWRLPGSCKKIAGQLSAIATFDISRLGNLIGELEKELQTAGYKNQIRHTPFVYGQGEYPFDEMGFCERGILGTFHDPLREVGQITTFDPLMKFALTNRFRGFDSEKENAVGVLLTPLGCDSRSVYFHAPDDVRTGKRPVDFAGYSPKTLWYTRPSESEIKAIMQCAEQLNGSSFPRWFLPHREHIVWIDGEIRILWRLGTPVNLKVDYRTYFNYLLTGETGFSDDDWLVLLKNLSEMRRQLTREISLRLLKKTLHNWHTELKPLLEIAEFRQQITGEEFDFTGFSDDDWLVLLKNLPEMKNRLNPEICSRLLKCFLEGNPRDLAWLFGIAEFQRQIAGKDVRFTLPQWLAVRKYTRDYDDRIPLPEEISLKNWNHLLASEPALVKYLPDDKLPRLARGTWLRLLGCFPELAGQCPCLARFTPKNWGCLLLQQPQLAALCPAGIEIPEKWEKRMRKKNGIPRGTGQTGRNRKKNL